MRGRGGLRADPQGRADGRAGRADFDACLDFLAGDLAAPPGAYEPEPGAAPRWTSPRIWKRNGWFGVRGRRVTRWFWSNVGTITSEETAQVLVDGVAIGTLEGAYAERLVPGDRFVLDGRSLEFRRRDGLVDSRSSRRGRAGLPIWHSDRQSLSSELAREVAEFRAEGARRLTRGGPLGPAGLADRVARSGAQGRRRPGRADRGPGAPQRGPPPDDLLVEECPVDRRAGIDLRVPRPAQPRGVRGAGAGDRGPAGPPVRPRPGASGRRPGLVDPPARGGRPRPGRPGFAA